MKTEPPEQTARRIGIIIRNGGHFDFTDGLLKLVCLTPGTAISITVTVAARRPAAGSNSWTGQTHERGQQGQRQGRPRGGLGIECKAENDPSAWTLQSYTHCLIYVARDICSLSPTPGNETSRASRQPGADRGMMRPAGRPTAMH